MPRVPTYGDRKVGTAALPGARVSADVPIGAYDTGQSLPELGPAARLAREFYETKRNEANYTAVFDADNALGALNRQLAEDPKTGFLARRGKDAAGSLDDIPDAFEKRASEIEAGMSNDTQRKAFRAQRAKREAQLHDDLYRHVTAQTERYKNDTLDTALATSETDAITGAHDPARISQALTDIRDKLTLAAPRFGWDKDQLGAEIAKRVSRVHAGVLARYVDQKADLVASEYFEKHKGEISGAVIGKVESMVQEGSSEGEAQRRVDLIMQTPNITRTDAFKLTDQITNARTRKAAEERLDVVFRRRDQAERDAYVALSEQANAYLATGTLPPPSIMSQLTVRDQQSARVMLRQAARGEPIETDLRVFYDLQKEAVNSRAKFLKRNLWAERRYLDDGDFKYLVKLQADMLGGRGEPEEIKGFQRVTETVDQRLRLFGLDPNATYSADTPKTDKSKAAQRVATFYGKVDADVKAWKRASGKTDIPDDEILKIVDRLLVRSDDGRGGFEFDITDVPEDAQTQIRQALLTESRNRGVPFRISNEIIVDAYRRQQQRAGVRP